MSRKFKLFSLVLLFITGEFFGANILLGAGTEFPSCIVKGGFFIDQYSGESRPIESAVGIPSVQTDRKDQITRIRGLTIYQMVFSTLPLAFGLIHLILFFFFKKAKENLYFAIFLFFYSASIFFDYQNSLYADIDRTLIYLRIHRLIQPFYVLFSLRFVYSLFFTRVLKRFWIFAPLLIAFGAYAVYSPSQEAGYSYFSLVTIPITLEIFRVIGGAVWKRRDGAWLIAIGYFIFFFFSFFDTLMDLGVEVPFTGMENPYAFGTVGFLVTMSVYLARRYSNTYKKMLVQEAEIREKKIQQRLLKAENQRKSLELEEARKLQLSMLPECVTSLTRFDVCFHMEPATEVGGDYYDFLIDQEKNLFLAVGDATGHGMKAGIMVATIKSMFHSRDTIRDIPEFFNHCTDTIKKMHMGNLFMALSVTKFEGNIMKTASAGMPHILIYRCALEKIDELQTKGPPLGGFAAFPYQQKQTILEPGDTVLLMSDGFPEQFNEADEMMGYERAKAVFKAAANGTPVEIVKRLCKEAVDWRGSRDQDDDITFVVVKSK